MKRILALTLVLALIVVALASCKFDPTVKSEGVMTYDEYVAAELDTEVTIEAFVQAKQGWWTDDKGVSKATFYLQDTDGGYLAYDLPCSEEEYNKLTVGTRVQITGYKSEWKGEVEIIDATFKILNGNYVATAVDVTDKLGADDLSDYMNRAVTFTGMTIVAANEDGDAFLYGWDGSGVEGGDIYFNASVGGKTYTFVIESYLTGKDTDVYKAAQALKVGDVVDLGGFLYWYNGAQPHIVSIETAE